MIRKNIRDINTVLYKIEGLLKIKKRNKFSETELDDIISDVVGNSVKDFETCKGRILTLNILEPISTEPKSHESAQIKN